MLIEPVVQGRLIPVGGRVALRSGAGGWLERRGVLLELRDAAGRVGRGEASPLPRYSPETLAGAAAGLQRMLDEGSERLAAGSGRLDARLPSARFALESALLDLAGQQRGCSAARLLGASGDGAVPLSALIEADGEAEVEGAVSRALQAGFRSLKLKVGTDLDRECRRVAVARQVAGEEVELRLDANRSWSPEVARQALARLARYRPAFVEEPVAGGVLPELRASPVPLALDESLPDLLGPWEAGADGALDRLRPLLQSGPVTTLVLKPALLGGLVPVRDLARRVRAAGLQVVITHLWDGPVALAAASSLALALQGEVAACGLARHGGLAAYTGPVAPWVGGEGGQLRPPAVSGLGLVDEVGA